MREYLNEGIPERSNMSANAINTNCDDGNVATIVKPNDMTPHDNGEVRGPFFIDEDDDSCNDVPPFITTVHAGDLYDVQPGETVIEAAVRKAAAKG